MNQLGNVTQARETQEWPQRSAPLCIALHSDQGGPLKPRQHRTTILIEFDNNGGAIDRLPETIGADGVGLQAPKNRHLLCPFADDNPVIAHRMRTGKIREIFPVMRKSQGTAQRGAGRARH